MSAREESSDAVPPSAVGVDTGGTFTDFVALAGDRVVMLKVPSTPAAPERAVLEGLARLGVGGARGRRAANRKLASRAAAGRVRVRHGSTVATNTLLERKGARVAFVTTAGFEDLIEIGRQERPDLYALAPRRVEPLVPAERRVGVAERIGAGGRVLEPLTPAAARRAVVTLRRLRPQAVAVGLLHSYSEPAHERRLERALAPLGVPVSTSSALCPEVREYERFATTVTNAYLLPRVSSYLAGLSGVDAELEIILSHGGTAPPDLAAREPVRQLLSGPAAGLEAAAHVARACGQRFALTLDVGGTSTDCAFVAGEPRRRRAREVAGFPVQLPVLDVHSVGAGGGSIARVDAGGLLEVGPESAGADPGPACYGRGGPATVTDALVVLGRIPGEALAGGSFPIDRSAALAALKGLGEKLGGRDAPAAAEAVVAVADSRIEAALRRVSVEQGHDPRDAALVAFGGAGGLHACGVAEALGVRTILFPRHAGVLSALGALAGASRREASRSVLLDAGDGRGLERAWRALEAQVRRRFRGTSAAIHLERWAEVRYRGQSHELSLPVATGGEELAERFHHEHERRFGFADRSRPVEVVTVEVRGNTPDAWGSVGAALGRDVSGADSGGEPATQVRVRHGGSWHPAAVWERGGLAARRRGGDVARTVSGPAIVLEEGATLWVAPGWDVGLHESGTLVLARRGPGKADGAGT